MHCRTLQADDDSDVEQTGGKLMSNGSSKPSCEQQRRRGRTEQQRRRGRAPSLAWSNSITVSDFRTVMKRVVRRYIFEHLQAAVTEGKSWYLQAAITEGKS